MARRKKYQKGSEVKRSLKYKPGFPTTGDKPSPYDLKTLKKAIARDSTKVADRGMIGDFFDPGVTSGSTGPSDQYNLQINREYRDKVTGADSERTAKKINKMKQQTGGPYTREQRKTVKKSGKAMKKHGRKLKRAGSQNKMAGFEKEGDAQIEAGMAFKKEGRNRKKMSRKMRDDNYIIENKELVFGKPDRKKLDTSTIPKNLKAGKKQKGGSYSGSLLDKAKQLRAETKEIGERRSNENKRAYHARLRKMGIDPATLRFDKKGSRGQIMKDSKKASPKNPKPGPYEMQKGGRISKRSKDVKDTLKYLEKGDAGTPKEAALAIDIAEDRGKNLAKGGKNYRYGATKKEKAEEILHRKKQREGKKPGSILGNLKNKQKGGLKTPTAKQKGLKKLPTSVRNKMGYAKMGGMKYGKGGMKDKKFFGGLAGAIGGAKGGGGLKGMLKGAMGGSMLGRGIGALRNKFGNSNPMAQQQAQQAQGVDPAMAQQAPAAPAAQDPAMQDPAAQQMAQRGGQRRRNRQAKNAYKKSVNRRGKTKNRGIKLGRTGTKNCIKGDC